MKIFLIHADEDQYSFSSTMGKRVIRTSIQQRHSIVSSDLYEKSFNPLPSIDDFKALKDPDNYQYQQEQVYAAEKRMFSEEIQTEMDKIERSDLLVFTFPLKWFSMPIILKGWVEKVLAYGYSYGGQQGIKEKGRFSGKKIMLAITANDPTEMYLNESESLKQALGIINHTIFGYHGFSIIEPYIIHQTTGMDEQTKENELDKFEKYLVEVAFEQTLSELSDSDIIENDIF